jgi:dTDP-4-amino-4,6-dideoxygalactose transaminase
MQKAYADARYNEGDFPITEQLCKTVFSLPIHTEMDSDTQQFIIESVLTFFNS